MTGDNRVGMAMKYLLVDRRSGHPADDLRPDPRHQQDRRPGRQRRRGPGLVNPSRNSFWKGVFLYSITGLT